MTPSDALALARLSATVPVAVLVLAARPGEALALFAVAAATDAVDGPLARRRGDTSARGAVLDQLADKTLVVGVLAALVAAGAAPAWAFAAIAAREAAVAALRAAGRIGASSTLARAKTTLQFAAVAVAIAGQRPLADALLAAAVAAGLASAAGYLGIASRERAHA
ncbi:MAG TPA: CDP-alcohol phosphatidyltransferase family protein [Candidatus Limnocylindria bacterium]|nr:CDP-alcohol phosphatidyltransferase family protein [Candidatus Limnocylindria bacterium]